MLGHNRKMSGAECLADMLKGYGVTHIFHVPAVLRKTMAVMEGRTEIKRLHVHGEKAAAYMADGYARASGKPGICAAQVIGALNLAAGLRDAWLAHSPVIAMTGGREPRTKFRKVYQEVDDLPAFEPVTKFNATDAIPGNHPLAVGVVGTYSRESANRVVNAADLVCFVGTETGGMTTHFWAVPKIGTPAIQIDIDPQAIGRNYPLLAGVNGDAKLALARMLAAADRASAGKRKAWVEEAQRICKEWSKKYAALLTADAAPIRPERICAELTRNVPDDAIVVVDTGHAGMWMGGMFDLTSPRQSYMRSAGHLGWAFPAGLGAKCACPERPVITFTGDAGLWYHIAEIETAARWNINAVT